MYLYNLSADIFFYAVTEAVSKLFIRTSGDPWIVLQNTFIAVGAR